MLQSAPDVDSLVTHRYADNGGVRLHYATLGEGPLIVMLHGFPDFWYTWRGQMPVLARHYRVAAPDLRGYNLSGQPRGGEQYAMRHLLEDVAAVIRDLGEERATLIGHDWGGAISWQFAMHHPQMVERLVILNLPHPRGMARELAHNPEQERRSAYARTFQEEGAHEHLDLETLIGWVTDEAARERYREALGRSDLEGLLHYYKQNYPRPPYREPTSAVQRVQAPTLVIHGLDDQALLPGGLNETWQWVERDLTLVTLPGAGHFVQHDASEAVTQVLTNWLARGPLT